MDVKVLGLNPSDLEFPDLRTISETRICSAFGVPPILIGAKAGLDRSTFANYKEARTSFWEETIMPLQRRISDVITSRLLPQVLDAEFTTPRRVTVQWDRSQVLALKESEHAIWERANNALRAGAITVADFRRIVGLPAVEGADVFLRPAGVVPTLADGTPTGGAAGELPAGSGDEADDVSDEELAKFLSLPRG
jgi:phage portal protein BeeE